MNEKIKELENEIQELKKQLNSKDMEINDLNIRLKKAFSVDSITQNQELVSLKNNISNSLKLQYADFNAMKSTDMNEDNYQFFKITLKQVFKALKRNGIDL